MSGRYIKFTNYVVNVNNSALSIYRILSSWQNWHSLILSLWTAPAMMVSDHNSLLTYLTLVCKQNDGFETSWTWWKKSWTLCYLSSVVDFMFECWCVCMLLTTDLVATLYPLILMGSKCFFFHSCISHAGRWCRCCYPYIFCKVCSHAGESALREINCHMLV